MGYDDETLDNRNSWPGQDAGTDGRTSRDDLSANGVNGVNSTSGTGGTYAYESEEESEEGAPSGAGRWVSRGGVLVWEEPEAGMAQPAAEAESRWAEDEIDLPPGAPAGTRIRAVRAWLLAHRQREHEALGMLLLEQRRMQPEEEPPAVRRGARELSPLELAMAEHEAAANEYESLVEALAHLETHTGPQRVLVEYYLAVADRLAELANAPEAPADFAPHLRTTPRPVESSAVSPRAEAEWQGRASAIVQTRRRIERVTAPETEE